MRKVSILVTSILLVAMAAYLIFGANRLLSLLADPLPMPSDEVIAVLTKEDLVDLYSASITAANSRHLVNSTAKRWYDSALVLSSLAIVILGANVALTRNRKPNK